LCGTCGVATSRTLRRSPRATEIEHLAVGQGAWGPVEHVVERQHDAHRAVRDLSVRRRRQEVVDGAALIGLDVRECDPAQPFDRHHARDRLAHQREQLAHPRVVEQRLLCVDEELVEREAGRADLRHERRDAVDAVGDLVDLRVGHFFPLVVAGWP
jgi:anion-transporting  ArsA/GET3 family ATPase